MADAPGSKLNTLRTKHTATLDELDKYKLLVDSVQDYAIFLMDAEGYIQTWNKGAQRNKGYAAEDIIGKHFSIFYMPEDIEAQKPEKELAIATEFGRAEDEDWRIRQDGSRFWASVVITALHDPQGKLVGFAKVTRDLTERKLYEDELRRANTLLKAQQEELKRLNQSKDEFISLASHQLRTPATAIKQLLGLFVEGFQIGIADNHLEIIKKAYKCNERQINIVNSLLRVAQVDAGKVKLHLAECDLRQLTEDIIDDFRNTVLQRNQNLTLRSKVAHVPIMADAQNLRMAIENLISNASKYTHPHGSITIDLKPAKGEPGMTQLAIKDTGVGIAKEDIGALFEKFRRLPNALSDEVGGTGLGLYWAHEVIALHGGRIDITSEPGKGSTFTVYLPTGM